MDNNDFDKYVQYVIAQVGEGNHSKDEMKEDLLSRGLSNEDVDDIIKEAYALGMEAENEVRKEMAHPTKSVAEPNQTPTIPDRKRTECPLPHAVGF